jgi:hypothetical protein
MHEGFQADYVLGTATGLTAAESRREYARHLPQWDPSGESALAIAMGHERGERVKGVSLGTHGKYL